MYAEKLVQRSGQSWCMDVLDVFVSSGQSVARGMYRRKKLT